ADALDVLGHEQEVCSYRYARRFDFHPVDQAAIDAGVAVVDSLVLGPDRQRLVRVALAQAGDDIDDLPEREVAELGDFVDPLIRRMRIERDCTLGDVRGEIADTLKLYADAQCAEHLAQVARDRLAQSEHPNGARIDLAFELVDLEILAHDAR